ncbi:MAG: adenosylhomocysteinase [Candidatus Omnitrophica bacterium]|nr:adenosylhomocysteinase [Candidatus Omnitrophota bacterium]
MKCDVKDLSLAKKGRLRVEWAAQDMPVLELIRKRFQKEKPFRDTTIACCLHVTTETANLMITLAAGGATVALCASNPLSTQDDVAAFLVKECKIPVFAINGEDNGTYYRHIAQVLDFEPNITIDDGADLVSTIHIKRKDLASKMLGGTEETTTGVIRLKSMEKKGLLLYPLIAVNDAKTKHLFDNRYGTGQSTIDGILRATNRLIAGTNFVVAGYGWGGRGVAMRAKGLGANVIILEIDPLKALEAAMDGFTVMPAAKAASIGDIFVTVTGNISVLRSEHFLKMKDGVILANSGHFNVEIDLIRLRKLSKKVNYVREHVQGYTLKKNQRRIYVLGEGRLINLAAAEGHPAQVMDMSFANQSLGAEYIKLNSDKLENKVYPIPEQMDKNIAKLKLIGMDIKIDRLTAQQKKYLSSWEMGT